MPVRSFAIAALGLLLAGPCLAAEPAFEDFPAATYATGSLQRVVPPAAEHSPFLDRAVGRPADFAGRYVLAINGCGTACQQVAAIDVETGATYLPADGVARNGACYRLDSRLLVLDPIAPDVADKPPGFTTRFYEMTDAGFVLVGQSASGTSLDCDDA
ncbi:hypothetical protein [Marilutibacter aestuarii]|uniref:Secreted protein n=1 Tax=Marilutibacter aestuarii TaxID=1706195 RepID=A0A508AQU9_9GAMM|nr:hypothetical protein [Lysobacter aestuarii]TQD51323.1 hypothetical protein FKV25_01650 [Lysobacter aestuarii]